jgi:nucleotide-binding universal stress UspA family protein
MSIKTILLHLVNDDRLSSNIEIALGLATENDAHVVGVYTVTPATPPTSFMGYIPPEFIERTRALEAENAEKTSAVLKEAAAKVNISVSTYKEEGYALDILNKHALVADLVIVGQVNSDDDRSAQYQYLADELVVSSPCPVLAVPYAGKYQNFGEHVLIGWNNTREAARAVSGALPFLIKAKKVTLLSVNPTTDQTAENSAAVAHLKRHGVNAEIKVGHWRDIGIGNALLDALVDYNADMLVMGAYGHSRIREMILGGATQEILEHMTAPILFAH